MAQWPKSKLLPIFVFLVFISLTVTVAVVVVILKPWAKSSHTTSSQSYVTVTTKYGDIRGLTYKISQEENLDVFFGVPFAQPPVGEHRFAAPRPVEPWSPEVKNATRYGNVCLQQNTREYNMTSVSEDCLYLNIYSPRHRVSNTKQPSTEPLPVMLYIHGGSFRDGSSIYFNYTNLALKGVVVVTTNYRLDAIGFLSTQDDVIPGNFGLLDTKLALEFVKEVISSFRGDPQDITMFGASAGSALVTQMALSPLTRGKFQKAILQSGPGTAYWSSYKPGSPNVPREVALDLGRKLDCQITPSETDRNQSLALLACLRDVTAQDLIAQIHNLTVEDYRSDIIFVPVSGDAFGFLPQSPRELAANSTSLIPIPTIFGWSTNDSSWTIDDPGDKGENYDIFLAFVRFLISVLYPSQQQVMFQKALELYNLTDPSQLSPYDVRSIDALLRTDLYMESFIVKEARQFSRAAAPTEAARGKAKTFVYQFDYRPSYKKNPRWQGVTHMDERGMVLGLPNGPDPFTYPVTNQDDHTVGELMTTMWSNFAKYNDPTPEPLSSGVKWPEFGHKSSDQNVLLIRPEPRVKRFDRDEPVVFWTGSSGLDD